jgi:hypothetical protein
MTSLDRVLTVGAAAHGLLVLVAGVARILERAPIAGTHPADKPLKFALSIALYLLTMAWIVPMLPLQEAHRRVVAWTLFATMVAETVPIFFQAARGVRSHFNVDTAFDAALWRTMVLAIVVASLTMAVVAIAATRGPLLVAGGRPLSPLLSFAIVSGLWLFVVAVISGFAMGGRLRHSIGGEDGGAGLPVVGWSRSHGDLRAPHFVGVHSLQTLPLAAWLLERGPGWLAWGALLATTVLHVAVATWCLARAFGGRPVPWASS